MAKRRHYDDKFRASAVVMLEAAGYPDKKGALAQVAAHCGVPEPTLHRWAREKNNPPPSDVVNEKRGELTDLLRDLAYKLVAAMPDKIGEAGLQQQGTTLGIVIDKLQLLEGKATERVDHTGLNRDERIARVAELLIGRRPDGVGGASRRTDD